MRTCGKPDVGFGYSWEFYSIIMDAIYNCMHFYFYTKEQTKQMNNVRNVSTMLSTRRSFFKCHGHDPFKVSTY